MLFCGIVAKPVAHLMQYHLLQWEVAKIKQLMTSNMTLTVLNLHQRCNNQDSSKTRGSLAKQSDCFCMAKTKRPKRKMVLAAYNRKKILPRYPVNLKLHRKKIGKFKMV